MEESNKISSKKETMPEPKSKSEMIKAMRTIDPEECMFQTEIETFRMAEGKDKKNDVHCNVEQEGLELLREMVNASRENAGGIDTKRGKKWKFRNVPHEQFDKTMDDVYLAFVRWAIAGDTSKGKFNVSKAYRRLVSYADWMEEQGDDLLDLTADSVKDAWFHWKAPIASDAHERLIWWWDVSKINLDECKKISPKDSLRLFVWLSHLIMFDDSHAQRHGMVFVMDWAKMGLWTLFHVFPMKLGLALDRLTIGVLPIRMEAMYMIGTPTWCKLIFGVMKPFMSKKMRSRIVTLKDNNHKKIVEDLGGVEFVPKGFGTCGGTMELDVVTEKYFS